MLAYCQTPKTVVMATVTGSDGIVRMLADDINQPGLIFEPKPLQPIVEQITTQLQSRSDVREDSLRFHIRANYTDELTLSDGVTATLYIATATASQKSLSGIEGGDGSSWRSIPDVLRSMPQNRSRLVYLRAWQVLLGALEDGVKAIDFDEAMRHLNRE